MVEFFVYKFYYLLRLEKVLIYLNYFVDLKFIGEMIYVCRNDWLYCKLGCGIMKRKRDLWIDLCLNYGFIISLVYFLG